MPLVILHTGVLGDDGQEVVLSEYLCDWPNCGNVAEQVVGVVLELGVMSTLCTDHAAMLRPNPPGGSQPDVE